MIYQRKINDIFKIIDTDLKVLAEGVSFFGKDLDHKELGKRLNLIRQDIKEMKNELLLEAGKK